MEEVKEVMVFLWRMTLLSVMNLYYTLESLVLWFVPRKFLRKDVSGSVVVVTGGGSGIGRLMCTKLAAKGAIIVTWDVSEEGNKETARLIEEAGGKCHTYTVDLCDREAVYATAGKVKEDVGKVDILINNAGIVTGKSLLESPDDSIMKTFLVNSICHFWTTKAFLGDMISANKGHIVTIASMAGKGGFPGLVDYCSSKFAAVGFHESLQAELKAQGNDGVKTTVVCPMIINTGMFEGARTRFLPAMDQDWVVEQVVDAILMDQTVIMLPRFMIIAVLQTLLLPQKTLDLMGKMVEAGELMTNFVGRKKKE